MDISTEQAGLLGADNSSDLHAVSGSGTHGTVSDFVATITLVTTGQSQGIHDLCDGHGGSLRGRDQSQ